MTDSTGSSLDQVAALDEERRRYEAWLAQLDERHVATPERVLQRVRADYQERLHDVVTRLGEHAELLSNAVEERARTVDELRAAEQEHQDARAEAELRAMVGEYGPEQWRELAAQADEQLASLAERRGAAEAELARLEQVLALARQADGAEPAAPDEAATATASLDDVAAARTEEWPSAAAPADMAGAVPAAEDWPAEEVPETPPPRIVERHREARAPEPAAADWFVEEPALAPPPPPPPASGHAASAATQAKTLRCQECGTMNYPTEWYCERCGGELATL